uniref:Uncharacterized protein n=1 Tax=Onchocerca volvulus TaxID=6282 RepID=A0A044RCN8_ONCVO
MNLSDVHSSSIKRLIMPRICYQDEQQQHEIKPFVPIIVSFRIPTMMVDTLVGEEDQRALLIAYETETDLTLPRRFQSPIFTINGTASNIRRALRIIEKIINEDCCDPCSSAYAFIADPNMDQSGTDYILCNGTIDEAKYKPKEKKCFNN